MDERHEIRISNSDREAAVHRLRAALDEGRLNLYEYDDRLTRAYQSVTYGEITQLFVDLPETPGPPSLTTRSPTAHPPVPRPAAPPPEVRYGIVSGMPTWLKVLWALWATAVSINLVIWTLVGVASGDIAYFWPVWVAGPWGGGLVGLTAVVTVIRRGNRPLE